MRLVLLPAAVLLIGCAPVDATFEPPDLDFNRMLQQPRYDAYEMSPYFDDQSVMRHPPEGTVPFAMETEGPAAAAPSPTLAELRRGRVHFEQVCAACHGTAGTGETPVADRMQLRPPPSLHTDKARGFTDAQLHDIVRDGYGLMPAYDFVLEPEAQVEVVRYVRALQLSQHADVAELPPDMRRKLPRGTR